MSGTGLEHNHQVRRRQIMLMFGTRPEAIKMCPLVRYLREEGKDDIVVVATGQHREMLDQVLEAFDVSPDYDLDLLVRGQTLVDLTARSLTGIAAVLGDCVPDLLLVQGDTTTAFAAALAAFYAGISIGHVEAGLRTGNIQHPFPEEANRRLIAQVAELHFAPTTSARRQLLGEGVPQNSVFVTGNTGIDALASVAETDESKDVSSPLVLVTAHRRESWGEGMRAIAQAVGDVADARPDVTVVFPLHRNAIVREVVTPLLGNRSNVQLVEPVGYRDFVTLIRRSTLILTDSGGIQEEAPAFGIPVLVMRETTERPEAVEFGTARLVGVDRRTIADAALRLLGDPDARAEMARTTNPYGDGQACTRIAGVIDWHFGRRASPPDEFSPKLESG